MRRGRATHQSHGRRVLEVSLPEACIVCHLLPASVLLCQRRQGLQHLLALLRDELIVKHTWAGEGAGGG